jgi:hypothetical protein
MGKRSMIAYIVLTALLCIFVATCDAAIIAAFASLIRVRHCVVNIKKRFAPGFRNCHMFVMVVKTGRLAL